MNITKNQLKVLKAFHKQKLKDPNAGYRVMAASIKKNENTFYSFLKVLSAKGFIKPDKSAVTPQGLAILNGD